MAGPHNFKELLEGYDVVLVRVGFWIGGLVGMIRIRVRSWVMHHVSESPHKVRSTRMCVCRCACEGNSEATLAVNG